MFKKFFKKYNNLINEIIHILFIIIFVLTMLFSNVYIKFIPMFYILGILSICLFNQKIITSLLVGISSMLAIYFFDLGDLKYNLIYTSYFVLSTFIGEICGQVIMKIKKINSKSINNIILVIFLFIFNLLLHNYFYGNLYTYVNYTNNLKEYLNYNYDNYSIIKSNYLFSKYKYFVKIDDDVYNMYVYGDNIIKDEYKDNKLDDLILDLNNEYNSRYNNEFKIKINNDNNEIVLNIVNTGNVLLDDYINRVYKLFNEIVKENKIKFDKLNMNYIDNDKIKFASVDKINFSNLEYYRLSFFDEVIK